jgi:hypothetical protein
MDVTDQSGEGDTAAKLSPMPSLNTEVRRSAAEAVGRIGPAV